MTDASGSSVYLYNIHGELVKETRTTAGQVFVTEYGYTGNGEDEYIIYPSDRKIIWTVSPRDNFLPCSLYIRAEPASWLKTSAANPLARSPA